MRQTAIPVGGALAAVALPLVNAAGGLKASFIFLGAVCLVSAAVAAVAIREAPRSAPELEAEDVEWTLRDSRLWVLSTGSGLYLFAQIALTAFLVLFLHDVHGLSPGAAAAVLAVLQVGAVVTRISAGRISDAMQARIRPLRWIGLASAAGVLLTAVVTHAAAGRCRPGDGRGGCDLDGLERPLGDRRRRARRPLAQRRRDRLSADDARGDRRRSFPPPLPSSWRRPRGGPRFALASIGPLVGWYLLGRLPEIRG